MTFYKRPYILLLTILFPIFNLFSQTKFDTIPIKQQFEYIYNKSNNYSGFKVVNRNWFIKLQQNTLDSLKAVSDHAENNLTIINTQKTTINSLENKLEAAQKEATLAKTERDNMSFLGMDMTKSKYNGTMWALLLALLAGLAFFAYKFKNSNALTKDAQKLLKETEAEFEEHRRVALEREQKVRRQLQDEINKHKIRN